MAEDIRKVEERIAAVESEASIIDRRVERLEDAKERHALLCPFRDDIRRLIGMEKQVDKHQSDIITLRIDVAKLMVLAGGAGGLSGGFVSAIIYLAAHLLP